MKISPSEWIIKLSKILDNTFCRIEGKNISINEGFQKFHSILMDIHKKNNNVWWVANGGSVPICSHASQDLMNKLNIKSLPLTDASLLTCMSNDFGYENVYLKPLNILMQQGDLLIAISSSGNSKNIISSIELAKEKKLKIISLSGFFENNTLWNTPVDLAFYLNYDLYGHVEVGHELLIHAVIETLWNNEFK